MGHYGEHKLPELPYAYDALEPFIDEQTMRLHHDIHHNGYVNGLNKAEADLAAARESGDFSKIADIQRRLAFHGSGHVNHTLFWRNMCPPGDYKDPSGDLAKQIEKDFGSLENLKAQFAAAAKTVEGNGWGFLVWSPEGGYLTTVAAENHQKNFVNNQIPLLVLDVWEHAYYLKYQNKRGDYVENFFKIVNWENVAQNFANAKAYNFPKK
ncbi:superoxide dismutase [Bradymonas sediminis]|uniref:Superoxide dismutase n=1 Tax=Bradymonas sediminis TaxID=1548548 RepID=A0A2Z4FGN2_9DELT|nr:superoxide dismutase [Bradymonas sediminis]AWV87904.1 superoxide dismutase [Bradymonas sediminis]TDP62921.1 Fe-Mn family superoxide dismutase [Bradymonas sediminis]